MSDHLHTQPDEHLEARITAYVLGEASPFESAELEDLISKSPELQLFLNRTRALHGLLKEAETTSNTPAEDWKLPSEKREKLDAIFGSEETTVHLDKESRIRRASFRAVIGIAAVFVVTAVISRHYVLPQLSPIEERETIVNYMSKRDAGIEVESRTTAAENTPQPNTSGVVVGGAVNSPQTIEKENLTLAEAIVRAGGATEFGSKKRVRVHRDGEIQTYDLTNKELQEVILQPGDNVEVPQKNWFGCGASRDELVESEPIPEEPPGELAGLITSGLRSGDAAITDNSIDALLNNPDRTSDADLKETMPGLTGTFPLDDPGEKKQAEMPDSDFNAFAPDSPAQRKPNAPSAAPTKEIITGANASPVTPSPQREITFGDGDDFGGGWGEENTNVENSAKGRFRRDLSLDSGETTIAEAKKLRNLGKYEESRKLLEKAEQSAPEDSRNEEELGYLDDPIRTKPALTEEHSKDVDDLRRKLYTAEGNYELGKYDDALETYEEALRIDPYNEAARRGMEKVANAKSDYYRAAYDQTRSELLMEVDKAWELVVPAEELGASMDEIASGSNEIAKGYDWSFDPFSERGSSAGALYARPPIDAAEDEPEVLEFEGFLNYGSGSERNSGITWLMDPELNASPPKFKMNLRAGSERESYMFRGIDLGDSPTAGKGLFYVLPEDEESITGIDWPSGGVNLDLKPKINLVDLSEEIPATEEPFSTFSLNISDASFQIARAAMEKGEQPDPAAIKPEQFYNAVNYGDPAPSSLEPVAAAIDQVAHPVIPGRNLVRVALRTASTGRSAAQPLRLTLLVDQSGSMVREDRRAAMETALEQLATLLTENDEVTVIGFSRTPRLLADSLPGDQAEKLPELINQTASEGGTNLEQAITLASELALRHKLDSAQNRIVLFTDGAANLGNADPSRLSESIEALRQQSISFDIAGIGTTDLNDNLLAELARHGNGRYYLVDENTGASLATQLAGAFRPAAENVKVQVVLNPNRVGNYKLIGFEKDRLKTEDFRNDSVDAAELAADEAGVAMYQVETLPEGSGEIGEVSVRFRDTASGEMVERTWTIPYDPSAPAIDKADQKTQLATLSLLAAQKLQGGPLADAINLRNFSETLARLKQAYAKDEKTTQMLTFIDRLK